MLFRLPVIRNPHRQNSSGISGLFCQLPTKPGRIVFLPDLLYCFFRRMIYLSYCTPETYSVRNRFCNRKGIKNIRRLLPTCFYCSWKQGRLSSEPVTTFVSAISFYILQRLVHRNSPNLAQLQECHKQVRRHSHQEHLRINIRWRCRG